MWYEINIFFPERIQYSTKTLFENCDLEEDFFFLKFVIIWIAKAHFLSGNIHIGLKR